MRLVLSLFFAAVFCVAAVQSTRSCAEQGLRKHKNALHWQAVMSTDPSQPFDARMFDFDFFAHKTPHIDIPSLAETDRIHSELCSERNSFEKIMLGDSDVLLDQHVTKHYDDLEYDLDDELIEEDAPKCKDDPSRTCSKGADSCGTRGYDAGQCPGDYFCCKKARRTGNAGQAVGPDAGGLVKQDNSAIGTPSSSEGHPIVPVPSNVMSGGISGIKIPIPQVPSSYVGIDLGIDVISKPDLRSFGGRVTVKLGLDFEVVNIYIYVALEGSLSGSTVKHPGKTPRVATFAGTISTTALYGIYAQAAGIKTATEAVINGLTTGLDSAGTPTYPSKLWSLYHTGFEKWYLQVYEDEWTYVTEVTGDQWKNRPSDAVILDAIKRIERMLEITPSQLPDGSLVWEYTASSTWTSTKLKYKMFSDKSWKWSPDGENWMKMSEITVKGGRWNGEKPTDDNIKTIQAIKLIYEDNPGLIASPGSALQVDAEVGCDCTNNPNQWGCGTYCSAVNAAKSGYNYAADKAKAGYNYVADKAEQGANYVVDKAKQGASYVVDKAKQGASYVSDKAQQGYNYVAGAINDAGKALVAAAKRTMDGFKSFYTKFKEAIKQTGVYRILQRSLFKKDAPRKPSIVFANLAEAMREEGFQNTDSLAEKALFVVDSALSRDFTRVLSLREVIMAFCLKNKSQADKISARLKEVFAHRTVSATSNDPYAKPKIEKGLQADMQKVRMDEVIKKMAEEEGGAKTEIEAAKELYMQLAPHLISRYEHIRAIALTQAERLKKLGDPTWGSLSFERQNEYRRAFFSLRGTIGELHTLLGEINKGDGWLKRGVLGGLNYIKEKVSSTMETVKAKTRAMIVADGVGLGVTVGLELGVGLAISTPKGAPGIGGSLNVEEAAMVGWTCSMDPLAFDDKTKTYSGAYAGVKAVISGSVKKGENAKIGIWGSAAIAKPTNNLCGIRYPGVSDCVEKNAVVVFTFPTNFGITPQKLTTVFALAMGASIGQAEAETNRTADLFKGLMNHIVPGSGGNAPPAGVGEFLRGFGAILTDYGLPMLAGLGIIPGTPTIKFGVTVGVYEGMKGGKRVTGFSGVGVSPSITYKVGLPDELQAAVGKLLLGAEASFSISTGFGYDIMKIFPNRFKEKPVGGTQAALAVDSGSLARVTDRSICEPVRLSARVSELRDALHYASHNPQVRRDIIATLGDLEQICSTSSSSSSSDE